MNANALETLETTVEVDQEGSPDTEQYRVDPGQQYQVLSDSHTQVGSFRDLISQEYRFRRVLTHGRWLFQKMAFATL